MTLRPAFVLALTHLERAAAQLAKAAGDADKTRLAHARYALARATEVAQTLAFIDLALRAQAFEAPALPREPACLAEDLLDLAEHRVLAAAQYRCDTAGRYPDVCVAFHAGFAGVDDPESALCALALAQDFEEVRATQRAALAHLAQAREHLTPAAGPAGGPKAPARASELRA